MLQIKRGESDNLGIIVHITPLNVCSDPLLKPSYKDSSNEGSQHMFMFRDKKISLNYPQYLLLSGTLMADVPFSISDTAFVVMATVLSLLIVWQVQFSLTLVVFTT